MLQYRWVFLAEQGIYYDEAMICFAVYKENIKGTLPFYSHTAILSIRMPTCAVARLKSRDLRLG
jgi:hypothetical protein